MTLGTVSALVLHYSYLVQLMAGISLIHALSFFLRHDQLLWYTVSFMIQYVAISRYTVIPLIATWTWIRHGCFAG